MKFWQRMAAARLQVSNWKRRVLYAATASKSDIFTLKSDKFEYGKSHNVIQFVRQADMSIRDICSQSPFASQAVQTK
jgi:hypothetical protein